MHLKAVVLTAAFYLLLRTEKLIPWSAIFGAAKLQKVLIYLKQCGIINEYEFRKCGHLNTA